MEFIKTLMERGKRPIQTGWPYPHAKNNPAICSGRRCFIYGFAVIEGMLMRIYEIEPILLTSKEQFFAILTAHPLVGIFGSTYSIVFGAFLFCRSHSDEKTFLEYQTGQLDFLAGDHWYLYFLVCRFCYRIMLLFIPFTGRCRLILASSASVGGIFFILGIAIVMVGTAFFVINIFKTIAYTPEGWDKQPAGALLASAIGLTGFRNLFTQKEKGTPGFSACGGHCTRHCRHGIQYCHYFVYRRAYPGLYGGALLGFDLKETAIDALLYKNWFWWGLDLIADGLVLIFVAGTWYLLATLITGKDVFMENIARAALLLELVVSWTVWSHHLLSDQAQPGMLKVVSGEMVTAFELITQGLAFFITLATLWSATSSENDQSVEISAWRIDWVLLWQFLPASCRPM